ncbi:MAG: glycosyltransferase family 2 protein [Hyphomonadaceae bacterium]
MSGTRISVIVCARNEEKRIADALASARACHPHEIIVVDGGSDDRTVAVAEGFSGVHVLRAGGNGLAFDRQLGADAASCELIAFVDADHRLAPGDLQRIHADMQRYGLDVAQAGVAIEDAGFWCRAENDALSVFHRRAGPRRMIGTAPALYRRAVLRETRFDTASALMSDDADLMRRIERGGKFRTGLSAAVVLQRHEPAFSAYVAKLAWYGRRDGAFMRKHPDRALSMLFHLTVRYPVLRALAALLRGRPRAVAYFWLAGAVRLAACLAYLASPARPRRAARKQAPA